MGHHHEIRRRYAKENKPHLYENCVIIKCRKQQLAQECVQQEYWAFVGEYHIGWIDGWMQMGIQIAVVMLDTVFLAHSMGFSNMIVSISLLHICEM